VTLNRPLRFARLSSQQPWFRPLLSPSFQIRSAFTTSASRTSVQGVATSATRRSLTSRVEERRLGMAQGGVALDSPRSGMTERVDMNTLIRRAAGREVVEQTSREEQTTPESVGGRSDGGQGGERIAPPEDMNAILRRATGRPGIVDEYGRAWS